MTKMKWYLYIDDERTCREVFKGFTPITARDYNSAIQCLREMRETGASVFIDLDHDLGEGKTGYDICKFIVEENYPLIGFHIHSMNPVGVMNMQQLLTHYGYSQF